MLGKPWLTVARVLLGMRSDISPILGKLLLEQIRVSFQRGRRLSFKNTKEMILPFSLVSGRFHAFKFIYEAQTLVTSIVFSETRSLYKSEISLKFILYLTGLPKFCYCLFCGVGTGVGAGVGKGQTLKPWWCAQGPKHSLFFSLRKDFTLCVSSVFTFSSLAPNFTIPALDNPCLRVYTLGLGFLSQKSRRELTSS